MKYITSTEYAKLHGVAAISVRQKCERGGIPGAMKVGEGRRAIWCIPEDAEYIDNRIRSGKYIGAKRTRKKPPEEPENAE